MASAHTHRPFHEVLDGLPAGFVPDDVRKRIGAFARQLDELGKLGADGPAIDEAALRRLLADAPTDFVDHTITALRELPDARLADGGAGGEKAPWFAVAEQVEVFHPKPRASFRDLGLSSSDHADVRKKLEQHFPDIPDQYLDPDVLLPRIKGLVEGTATDAESIPSSLWDCLVRHLGWWAAAGLVVVVGAALVAISIATGGAGTAAAWTVFWILIGFGLGGDTLVWVGNCILNPAS